MDVAETSGNISVEPKQGLEDLEEQRPGSWCRCLKRGGSDILVRHQSRREYRIPSKQYLALALWFALLLLQYGLVRVACVYEVPPDCAEHNVVDVLDDLQFLLFAGFALAILTGVHWPERFDYIFHFEVRKPRGVVFLAAFGLSGVGWGSLSLVPSLSQFSLTGIEPEFLVPLLALLLGCIFVLWLHLQLAFRYNSWDGFLAYIFSKAALIAFYSAYIVVKLQHEHENLSFHFHHYVVGYLVASICEINHPASIVLLACGTAVFVQGIAAYGAAPILRETQYHILLHNQSNPSQVLESPLMSLEAVNFVMQNCHAG